MQEKNLVKEQWEGKIKSEIKECEDEIKKITQEISKIKKEQGEYKSVPYEVEGAHELHQKGTALSYDINALNEQKNNLENKVLNLQRKLEIGYTPSAKLSEIKELTSTIEKNLNKTKNELKDAQKERLRLTEKSKDIKIKRNIAEEYNGDVERYNKLLKDINTRIENTDTNINELTRKVETIEKASDTRYVVNNNDIGADAPGHQLNRLMNELSQETDDFCDEIKHQWEAKFNQIENILKSFFTALTELGEIEAKVNLRFQELEDAGKNLPQLKEMKKLTAFKGNRDWLIDYGKIIAAYNKGKSAGF